MNVRMGNLMTIKELVLETGRSRTYIHAVKAAMERAGIPWTGNRISPEALLAWIRANDFSSTGYAAAKGRRSESGLPEAE